MARGRPATDDEVCTAIADAVPGLGLTSVRLPSGSGHDAACLAGIVPSGMVFVPSVGGVSHDPAERG